MKISQREMTLGVITLTAVLVGVTWYVIDGKLSEHKAKKSEIERLERQTELNNKRIKKQDEWIAELNELQKDLRVFDIKQRNVSPDLMKTVNTAAAKHGLNITRNQPRPEKLTDDLFEMAINCPWDGELSALIDFLAELQQQGVRYDIRSLDISPVGRNSGRLKGSMVLHCAYTKKVIPEEQPKPIAETPEPTAETNQPIAELTEPTAEATEPIAGTPKPPTEEPQPPTERPKPPTETPAPIAR